MKRLLGITCLVLFVSLVRPAPASAGLWAWLEDWSGPGPFAGYTVLFTACVQDGTFKFSPLASDDKFHRQQQATAKWLHDKWAGQKVERETSAIYRRLLANPDPVALESRVKRLRLLEPEAYTKGLQLPDPAGQPEGMATKPELPLNLYRESWADRGPGHQDKRLACGFIDQGYFQAQENPARGFPAIRAHMSDFGPSLRLHDGIDVGAGIGWVSFKGTGVDVPRHVTLTPIRVVLRPITMMVPEEHRKRWMGVLNVYWKETYFVGELNAANFGSSVDKFAVNGELIRSVGLNFDITALFRPKWDPH